MADSEGTKCAKDTLLEPSTPQGQSEMRGTFKERHLETIDGSYIIEPPNVILQRIFLGK